MTEFYSFTNQALGLQPAATSLQKDPSCLLGLGEVHAVLCGHILPAVRQSYIYKALQFINSAAENTVGEQGKGLNIQSFELCALLTTSWCCDASSYASGLGVLLAAHLAEQGFFNYYFF